MAPQYELVLMLDPEAPDERREKIADEARKRIESAGELKHADSWGTRKMSYEIRQRTEADYRFYRFESDGPLLQDLDHTLKITDGVLRFRIFKIDPGTPLIVPPPAMQPAKAGRGDGRRSRRGPEAERTEEPLEETPAEAPAGEPREAGEGEQAEAAEAEQAEPGDTEQTEPGDTEQAAPSDD